MCVIRETNYGKMGLVFYNRFSLEQHRRMSSHRTSITILFCKQKHLLQESKWLVTRIWNKYFELFDGQWTAIAVLKIKLLLYFIHYPLSVNSITLEKKVTI